MAAIIESEQLFKQNFANIKQEFEKCSLSNLELLISEFDEVDSGYDFNKLKWRGHTLVIYTAKYGAPWSAENNGPWSRLYTKSNLARKKITNLKQTHKDLVLSILRKIIFEKELLIKLFGENSEEVYAIYNDDDDDNDDNDNDNNNNNNKYNFKIDLIPENAMYRVNEYDGHEFIEILNTENWSTA
jgi:hypothetical protein